MIGSNIHTTALRMDKELYQRLAEEAKRTERSVNQLVVYFIRLGLERSEKP